MIPRVTQRHGERRWVTRGFGSGVSIEQPEPR